MAQLSTLEAKELKYQKEWSWPPRVEAWIRERTKGFSLHVCCGASTFGDVRLDLFQDTATVVGDMLHMPFQRNSFDTVICDPPWRMAVHLKPRLIYQLRDVLKLGGTLIFNAWFYPKAKGLRIVEVHIPKPKEVNMWSNFAPLMRAVKINAQMESFI